MPAVKYVVSWQGELPGSVQLSLELLLFLLQFLLSPGCRAQVGYEWVGDLVNVT